MRITPDAQMNALFEGRVVQDDAGCLRLDSPDPAPVVWPKGYGFVQTVEGFAVVDEHGAEIGDAAGHRPHRTYCPVGRDACMVVDTLKKRPIAGVDSRS